MNIERIHQYLQGYLDNVVLPNHNEKRSEPISLSIYGLRLGSYNPPIFHVFIDVEPKDTPKMSLSNIEKRIVDFLKVFSINSKVKIHWNKRPLF